MLIVMFSLKVINSNVKYMVFNLKKEYLYRTRVRSLVMLVSDSLPHSCLVNLIDVILACEDGNSKLIEIVTVANIDDEDRVGNSLLHTSELRLGNKAKLLFRL